MHLLMVWETRVQEALQENSPMKETIMYMLLYSKETVL